MKIKCINDKMRDKRGIVNLSDVVTINKVYDAIFEHYMEPFENYKRYMIIDDKGGKHELPKDIFITIQEHRNNILNKLI